MAGDSATEPSPVRLHAIKTIGLFQDVEVQSLDAEPAPEAKAEPPRRLWLPSEHNPKLYELRVYSCAPGKLATLNKRFRDHACKLFAKHGMENVGYWTPEDGKEEKLVYMLAHKDRKARDASFKAFLADPDWQKAYKASEADGPLVKKIVQTFLSATDLSPTVNPSAAGDRVFELRTYTATPGNLPALDSRFRDHTCKLFEKHGMTNLAYWHATAGEALADNTLIYLLAHKSRAAAKASFDAFLLDPAWNAARTASEQKAGGPLTLKGGGVKSEFLVPTDYSPWK